MGKLEGRVALITGAAGGVGSKIAERFAQEGAKVVVADRDAEQGRAVAHRIGGHCAFAGLDVTNEQDWRNVLQDIDSRHGPVDVLVNNAAFYDPKPLLETDLANWEAHCAVNMTGTFLGMRLVAPPMVERRDGVIINMSTNSAVRTVSGFFGYSATKWGIRGLTKAAAGELAPYNVRVNTILPGIVDAGMYLSLGEKCLEYDKLIPLGRRGLPTEVAGLATFIASQEGSYLAGAELVIDGAMFS